jgi:hypothetical protein
MQNDIIEIDNNTGEITLTGNPKDLELIKTTKIKALQLLNPNDFVNINGTWEAKRDGLIKILSSLPISYSWMIQDKILDTQKQYAQIVGVLQITTGEITRSSDGMGICEMSELKGQKSLHFMNARAETRALKRAIEVLFGSVINWYVVKYLA